MNALAQKESVIIAGDQWCPYVCDKKGDFGFSVELVQAALKEIGKESIYVNAGFIRLIKNIEENKWHVVTGTDESFSPNLLISKEPVAYTRWVFVTLKESNWKYKGVESLKSIRLGTVAGYVYSPEVNKYISENEKSSKVSPIYFHNPQKANLQKLLAKRIDVFLVEEAVYRYWAKTIGHGDAFRIAGLDFEGPLYCGLNKNAVKLRDSIDSGIRTLKKNGKIPKLLKKYDIRVWKN